MKKFLRIIILALILVTGQLEAFEFKRMIGPIISTYSELWPSPYYFILSPVDLKDSGLNPFRHSRLSFFGGIGLEFSVSRKIEVELDAIYKMTGQTYQYETFVFDAYRFEFEKQDLSFPLLLKLHPLSQPGFYFLTGGGLSFTISHRSNLFHRPEGSRIFEKEAEFNLKELTGKTDLALVLGSGYEKTFNRRKIGLEVRYEIGLSDLYKDGPGTPENQARRIYSRQFLLVLSYSIR